MGSFDALRHRNYRLLWTGALLSNTGTWMHTVALSWYVLLLTDSAFWVSFVTFVSFLPTVLSPIAGAYIDRTDRHRILVWAQLFMMLEAAVLAVLVGIDRASLFAVMALTFAQGLGFAVNAPAWVAFIPSLVPPRALVNALALNSAQFSLARITGPALAGGIIALWGPEVVFAINAVSFVTVLVALSMIRGERAPTRREVSVRDLLVNGFRYSWRSRGIRTMLGAIAVFSLFAAPVTALLPVFAAVVFGRGAGGYGALVAGMGAGSVLGAMMVGRDQRLARARSIGIALVALSAVLVAFALVPWYLAGVGLMVLYGVAFLAVVVGTNSAIQLEVEESLRGRVTSIWMMTFGLFYPGGSLLAGLAADAVGVQVVTAAGAVMCGAWGLAIAWRRRFEAAPARREDVRPAASPVPETGDAAGAS